MSKKKTNKPIGLSLKELALILPTTENALHQRCARMYKGQCLLYFAGFGYYSITMPRNKYILFLIQPEVKASDVSGDVKSKLVNILESAKDYVCDSCSVVVETMIDNVR
jgi:hypothetical protein